MLFFDYPATKKGLRVLVSARDSSFVCFIVAEAGLMKKTVCMIQWQHTHPGSRLRNPSVLAAPAVMT